MDHVLSNSNRLFIALAATCFMPIAIWATDLPVYTDRLVNGFQDWSWAARNLSDSSVAPHAGSSSIGVSANTWEAISFHQNDFDVSTFANLVFWANGGSSGGQRLQVQAVYGNNVNGLAYSLPTALAANTWQAFTIPLSALGIANRSNVNRFHIQLKDTGTTNTFFVDEIKFTGKPPPSLVHITASATQEVRGVESRWFGVNTAIW